ncbi:hypothetical protein ACLKA7_001588 [Drosophila subpalustris]
MATSSLPLADHLYGIAVWNASLRCARTTGPLSVWGISTRRRPQNCKADDNATQWTSANTKYQPILKLVGASASASPPGTLSPPIGACSPLLAFDISTSIAVDVADSCGRFGFLSDFWSVASLGFVGYGFVLSRLASSLGYCAAAAAAPDLGLAPLLCHG